MTSALPVGLRQGQKVQVFNPGPMSTGTVLKDSHEGDRTVSVQWDDGTYGWIDENHVVAAKLCQGTGIPMQLWLNLERAYRDGLAAGKIDASSRKEPS